MYNLYHGTFHFYPPLPPPKDAKFVLRGYTIFKGATKIWKFWINFSKDRYTKIPLPLQGAILCGGRGRWILIECAHLYKTWRADSLSVRASVKILL